MHRFDRSRATLHREQQAITNSAKKWETLAKRIVDSMPSQNTLSDVHLASGKGGSVATLRRDIMYAKTHEIQGHWPAMYSLYATRWTPLKQYHT